MNTKDTLRRWDGRRATAAVCALVGAGIPVFLAYKGSSEKPPTAAIQGLLAFVSVASQIAAAWLFSHVGIVDPSHPKRAIRRLEGLRRKSSEARRVTEQLVDAPEMKLADRRAVLGEMSVWMSVIQEEVVEAMEDWYLAMPHAIESAVDQEQEDDGA